MPEAVTTRTSVVERFLRYVTYDTQSAEGSPTYPSTAKQLVLLDRLVEELREIGLTDAKSYVSRPERSVWRKMIGRFAARQWIKEQQHPPAAAKKDMPPLLPAFELQAHHVAVKALRPRQIIDVQARFQNLVDVHRSPTHY